eukprot:5500416-Amphidinium_carterae.1
MRASRLSSYLEPCPLGRRLVWKPSLGQALPFEHGTFTWEVDFCFCPVVQWQVAVLGIRTPALAG